MVLIKLAMVNNTYDSSTSTRIKVHGEYKKDDICIFSLSHGPLVPISDDINEGVPVSSKESRSTKNWDL